MSVITTYTGKEIDLEDPQPEQICLADIVVGMARERRFSNQSLRPYSVLNHTIAGYDIITKMAPHCSLRTLLQWLLHDATEAYMRDIATPLKRLCPSYLQLEAKMFDVISRKYLGEGDIGMQLPVLGDLTLHDIDQFLGLCEAKKFLRSGALNFAESSFDSSWESHAVFERSESDSIAFFTTLFSFVFDTAPSLSRYLILQEVADTWSMFHELRSAEIETANVPAVPDDEVREPACVYSGQQLLF